MTSEALIETILTTTQATPQQAFTVPSQAPAALNTFARRFHKKSRHGCKRCKTRRCDEVHPACTQCRKHNVECDFNTAATPSDKKPLGKLPIPRSSRVLRLESCAIPSQTTYSIPSPLPLYVRSSSPSLSVADRMMDLRLFHHMMQLLQTRPYQFEIMQELWQQKIPALALQLPCLMDGMLTIAALHFYSLSKESTMLLAANRYITSTIRGFMDHLSRGSICPLNFDALYLTAITIGVHTMIVHRFRDKLPNKERSPAHIFRPFQGIKAVWNSCPTGGERSKLILIFPGWETARLCPCHDTECTFRFLLEGVESERYDYATVEAYRFVVAQICSLYNNPARPALMQFFTATPARFVNLLHTREPRSLVISGTFFAILKSVKQSWFIKGIADEELDLIRSILAEPWLSFLNKANDVVRMKFVEANYVNASLDSPARSESSSLYHSAVTNAAVMFGCP
ncbi:hypothetical protein DM02DRAFT_660139 [Periconia macrospinosa]|uniref:Zn(2)-C6 fungal-type domain-containing protein n=1 Tax=Periconia macrospinosa TaxID=97972 RepID=A0A2V1DBN7_9PLEO|nr:hypothetical protein DM02DRAFT_660139 [Periconia macrospinosa]